MSRQDVEMVLRRVSISNLEDQWETPPPLADIGPPVEGSILTLDWLVI
jgi:hypothetical protein